MSGGKWYGKLLSTFWTRGSGKMLRGHPEAQVLAVYLFSCPGAASTGIYYLPLAFAAHETGLSPEAVERAFVLLADPKVDIAHYDPVAELVWVPAMALWQIGPKLKATDNRHKFILGELSKYTSHRFYQAFLERYSASYHIENVSPSASPFGPPPKPIAIAIAITKAIDAPESPSGDPLPGVVQEPKPEKGKKTRGGRAARTVIPADWQPSAELAARVRAKRLDVDGMVEDFRNFWRNDGRLGADWEAAFRNNVAKVLKTEWLLQRWTVPENVTPVVKSAEVYGPPAAPPDGLVERMRSFSHAQRPLLAIEEPPKRKASR